MRFLKMILDLLMLKRRKKQYFNALKSTILNDILNDNTSYLYVDMWGNHGHAYAKAQLRRVTMDYVMNLFAQSLLCKEDGSNDHYRAQLVELVEEKFENLMFKYTSTDTKDIHVFTDVRACEVEYVLMLSGDTVHNQLNKRPTEQFNWSDHLYDLIGRIAEDDTPIRLFADAERMLNVFKVNKDAMTRSYSGTLSRVE